MGRERLAALYGGDHLLDRFRQLCAEHDPHAKFRNDWFARLLFGDRADHLELVLR